MSTPIADYALLSDCQGAALVRRDGSVDWWCAPRFDARASFGRLLDPAGGHFALHVPDARPEWRYVDDTMVLETTWTHPDGVVRVTDALALDPELRGHGIGRRVPHALVRSVEGISGTAPLVLEWSPRLEFGLVAPHLERLQTGVRSTGGGLRLPAGRRRGGARARGVRPTYRRASKCARATAWGSRR